MRGNGIKTQKKVKIKKFMKIDLKIKKWELH